MTNRRRGADRTACADVLIEDHGSIVLLRANTDDAVAWLEEHCITDQAMYFGNALAAEPRYVPAIAQGLREDGFTVAAA